MNCANNFNGRVNLFNNNKTKVDHLYHTKKVHDPNYKIPTNIEDNVLSNVYFSNANMKIIHNAIRRNVYDKSHQKYLIGEQDNDVLRIIMRGMFFLNGKHLPTNITKQVEDLNKHVVDYSVKQILGEIDGYIKYKRDVSTLKIPMSNPISSQYKHNTLELKNFF